MKEILRDAEVIARDAGGLLRRAFSATGGEVSHKSTLIDLVTDSDKRAEERILAQITKRYPDHGIWAEESGQGRFDCPFRWLVDPLDGTVNFAHRFPVFAVLLAVQERCGDQFVTRLAVTYDPLRDELFSTLVGDGVRLNGAQVAVSQTSRLIEAVVTTGFMYDRLFRADDNHREFCRLNLLTQGVRRVGSAGLDLAYVACGRFDAAWEYQLNPWDVAGGLLMVAEAGGRVSDLAGGPATIETNGTVASNGRLHAAMLRALGRAKALPIGSREGLADELPPELAERVEKLAKGGA